MVEVPARTPTRDDRGDLIRIADSFDRAADGFSETRAVLCVNSLGLNEDGIGPMPGLYGSTQGLPDSIDLEDGAGSRPILPQMVLQGSTGWLQTLTKSQVALCPPPFPRGFVDGKVTYYPESKWPKPWGWFSVDDPEVESFRFWQVGTKGGWARFIELAEQALRVTSRAREMLPAEFREMGDRLNRLIYTDRPVCFWLLLCYELAWSGWLDENIRAPRKSWVGGVRLSWENRVLQARHFTSSELPLGKALAGALPLLEKPEEIRHFQSVFNANLFSVSAAVIRSLLPPLSVDGTVANNVVSSGTFTSQAVLPPSGLHHQGRAQLTDTTPINGRMAKSFKLLNVLIASPGDCADERQAVKAALELWNRRHLADGIRFEPVMWETHAIPEEGSSPQHVINRQLVELCEYGIAIFKHRLGTPTHSYPSGTAEEVAMLRESGGTVSVYISDQAIPRTSDLTQFTRLKEYLALGQDKGLRSTFSTTADLSEKIGDWATHHARLAKAAPLPLSPPVVGTAESRTAVGLSSEAKILLQLGGADDRGQIFIHETNHQPFIRAGSRVVTDGTNRDFARWKSALDELAELGCIRRRSNAIFEFLDKGWKLLGDLTAVAGTTSGRSLSIAETGLSAYEQATVRFLGNMHARGGQTIEAIMQACSMSSLQATSTLKRLEDQNLVEVMYNMLPRIPTTYALTDTGVNLALSLGNA